MMIGKDRDDLPKNGANYTALTPLWFIERAAMVYPTRKSVVHGSKHYTWLQTYILALETMASVIATNVAAMCESQFGVLMAEEALKIMEDNNIKGKLRPPILIAIGHDETRDTKEIEHAVRSGAIEYEKFLLTGDPEFAWKPQEDEWQSIALGYTSGTTANPKGVVVSHRVAYVMSLSNAIF